jgi:hypothetical protein
MRRLRLAATLWLAPLCALRPQVQVTADVGSAVLRQTGFVESAVLTAGADVRWSGPRASFSSSALAAAASDGRGTGQGLITGALHGQPGGRTRWQVAGAASAYGLTNDLPTMSGQVMIREYIGGAALGWFVGGGGGGIVRNHLWRPALVGQSGAWWRRGPDQFLATISATSTVAEQHANYPAYGDYVVTNPAAFGDVTSTWQREGRAYSITVNGGLRAGFRGMSRLDGWGSATAERWVAPHVAVVASVGRALGDVVRGVPPTRYASLSLRMALQPRASLVPRPKGTLASGPRLIVAEANSSATRSIEVRVDSASSVEIMADFTSWEPVALSRDTSSGVWRLERSIEPGLHRIAVRIDGGQWHVPANLPRVSNGFGGTVGLVTVP